MIGWTFRVSYYLKVVFSKLSCLNKPPPPKLSNIEFIFGRFKGWKRISLRLEIIIDSQNGIRQFVQKNMKDTRPSSRDFEVSEIPFGEADGISFCKIYLPKKLYE